RAATPVARLCALVLGAALAALLHHTAPAWTAALPAAVLAATVAALVLVRASHPGRGQAPAGD
ncbi:DUF1275 domain-containing protein, partial [Streptomyces sp. SID8380]|nr:DUF1275 domain-containing protein [Streptomyces sp. SID8380]